MGRRPWGDRDVGSNATLNRCGINGLMDELGNVADNRHFHFGRCFDRRKPSFANSD